MHFYACIIEKAVIFQEKTKILAEAVGGRLPFEGDVSQQIGDWFRDFATNNRYAGLDNPTLFTSDGQFIGPEIRLVILGNGRHDRDEWSEHVCSVESAAQTDFDNRDLNLTAGKINHSHHGDKFEKRQYDVGCGGLPPYLVGKRDHVTLGDLLVTDANAFGKRNQMRRGI